MLIFDSHLDLAWNAVEWNRDLTGSLTSLRDFESDFPGSVPGDATVTLPEMRAGGIHMTVATLLPRLNRKEAPRTFYRSTWSAVAAMRGQLEWYRLMCEQGEMTELSTSAAVREFAQHCGASGSDGENDNGSVGFILSMEGSWAIPDPGWLEYWKNLGLTILGPCHYGPDHYGHGTGSAGGWNRHGLRLLKEMDRLGLLLDVTHLSDDCMAAAFDVFEGRLLASHHNCRTLVPGDRQLTDEQIRILASREAVIGLALDNWMIRPGWIRGSSDPATVSLHDAVHHIDHICQLLGTSRHCGIGSDLDGGFGREQSPGDLKSIADLRRIAGLLADRGYSDGDIDGIMHGNWIRFFCEALPQ